MAKLIIEKSDAAFAPLVFSMPVLICKEVVVALTMPTLDLYSVPLTPAAPNTAE
jgi:hypothetical protein